MRLFSHCNYYLNCIRSLNYSCILQLILHTQVSISVIRWTEPRHFIPPLCQLCIYIIPKYICWILIFHVMAACCSSTKHYSGLYNCSFAFEVTYTELNQWTNPYFVQVVAPLSQCRLQKMSSRQCSSLLDLLLYRYTERLYVTVARTANSGAANRV
jgi:hypothetical protein